MLAALFSNFISDIGFIIALSLFIPFVAAIVSALARSSSFRDIAVILLSFSLFIYIAALNINLLQLFFERGVKLKSTLFEVVPSIEIKFSIEPLGVAFAMLVSFLWLIANIYSSSFMASGCYKHLNRFNSFFALSILATLGIAFSGNLFTSFLFYEALTLVTYPLVTHNDDENAKKAGRKYLTYLMVTSLFLFVAIVWVLTIFGTTDFVDGGMFAGNVSPIITCVILLLVVYGTGKAALMPLHGWLVSAMVAPIPVSSLLHAVTVVKAGVFLIFKIITETIGIEHLSLAMQKILWGGNWLTFVAGFTIVFSFAMAIKQDEIKKILAYSTIGNLAYIILALSIFNKTALVGAGLHIIGHSFAKISLFFAAGAILTRSGKTRVADIAGLARTMPITFACFAAAGASLIGLPFTIGFLSKFFILIGSIEANNFPAVIFIAVGTILSCFYLLPPLYSAFFGVLKEKLIENRYVYEAPLLMLISLGISAAGVIVMFLFATKLISYITLIL